MRAQRGEGVIGDQGGVRQIPQGLRHRSGRDGLTPIGQCLKDLPVPQGTGGRAQQVQYPRRHRSRLQCIGGPLHLLGIHPERQGTGQVQTHPAVVGAEAAVAGPGELTGGEQSVQRGRGVVRKPRRQHLGLPGGQRQRHPGELVDHRQHPVGP